MTNETWSAIFLSLKCGALAAVLNLPWGIFWGYFLARKNFKGKILLQTFLYVPLVLPPVLTGYFLLMLLSHDSFFGRLLYGIFGLRFVLDWKGVVVAATVVSSPFMIQMVKQAVEQVDGRLELVAQTLGANFFKVFFTVTLPLAWQGIVSGFFLVFSRSMGEFGATIILAGNIPGKTQTIPLAIYNKILLGQEASLLPLVLAAIAFAYAGLAISQFNVFTRRGN